MMRLPPPPPEYNATPEQIRDYFARLAHEDAKHWEEFCWMIGCSLMAVSVGAYIFVKAAL